MQQIEHARYLLYAVRRARLLPVTECCVCNEKRIGGTGRNGDIIKFDAADFGIREYFAVKLWVFTLFH